MAMFDGDLPAVFPPLFDGIHLQPHHRRAAVETVVVAKYRKPLPHLKQQQLKHLTNEIERRKVSTHPHTHKPSHFMINEKDVFSGVGIPVK
jgi:hypothetical protein